MLDIGTVNISSVVSTCSLLHCISSILLQSALRTRRFLLTSPWPCSDEAPARMALRGGVLGWVAGRNSSSLSIVSTVFLGSWARSAFAFAFPELLRLVPQESCLDSIFRSVYRLSLSTLLMS